MESKSQNPNVVSQNRATETLNVKFNPGSVSDTVGSTNWLQAQPITLTFGQKEADGIAFRYAELTIGDVAAPIAADGALLYEDVGIWTPRDGFREVDLGFDSPHQQDLVFGVALTPAAIRVVERIATLGRKAFKDWIEEGGADGGLEIDLRYPASE